MSNYRNQNENSDSVVYDKLKIVGNPALKQYLINKENHLNLKHFTKPTSSLYGRNNSNTLTANKLKQQSRDMGSVYGIEDRRLEIWDGCV